MKYLLKDAQRHPPTKKAMEAAAGLQQTIKDRANKAAADCAAADRAAEAHLTTRARVFRSLGKVFYHGFMFGLFFVFLFAGAEYWPAFYLAALVLAAIWLNDQTY